MRFTLLRAVSVILTLWLGSAVLLDALGRRDPPPGTYDAIIVAGCRVDPGGQPSLALARRTRRGVSLWEQGMAPVLVFTGGVGAHPPAESDAAAALARSLGVPDGAIIVERESTSTEGNARSASQALSAAGLASGRVLVVTDSYHVFRATRVFGRYFAEVEGAGSTPRPWVRARGSLREVAAVAWYAANGRLGRDRR